MDLIKLTLDTRYIINIIENVLKWLVKEPVGVELAFLHNKTAFPTRCPSYLTTMDKKMRFQKREHSKV